MIILLSLESSKVLSILGLFTLGPSEHLLGFISGPNTCRNHITTSTSKSLYIYCAQCIQGKQNELIKKLSVLSNSMLAFVVSLFFIFSSFSLGLLFTLLFTQNLTSPSFSLMLLLSYPKSTTTKSKQIPNLSCITLTTVSCFESILTYPFVLDKYSYPHKSF